jgi:hypothetical protein
MVLLTTRFARLPDAAANGYAIRRRGAWGVGRGDVGARIDYTARLTRSHNGICGSSERRHRGMA